MVLTRLRLILFRAIPRPGSITWATTAARSKRRTAWAVTPGNFSGLRAHWNKCRALKKPLEVACVIGVPPNLSYAAVARIAPGLNEFRVAGGISGEPVQLVQCKTIDLQVPAHAEIVIEGIDSHRRRRVGRALRRVSRLHGARRHRLLR